VLEAAIGAANVAAPTLSSLATNFGAAPLIGRSVAIIPDARLSGRADAQVIIERLLSITGEDPQTIDRKHREDWTGNLRTRFVLGSNELPRLGDASGAFPGRVVLLKLVRSFRGREDVGLSARLLGELPGVLLWAIGGWDRLRRRGRFLQPASGQELLDELTDLSSPISSFLAERCELGSECRVAIKDLYDAWKKWNADHGRDHPGDVATFGRQLRSALPKLETTQPRGSAGRQRIYGGITLKTAIGTPY
jgi:putative DNA primase/helicase